MVFLFVLVDKLAVAYFHLCCIYITHPCHLLLSFITILKLWPAKVLGPHLTRTRIIGRTVSFFVNPTDAAMAAALTDGPRLS